MFDGHRRHPQALPGGFQIQQGLVDFQQNVLSEHIPIGLGPQEGRTGLGNLLCGKESAKNRDVHEGCSAPVIDQWKFYPIVGVICCTGNRRKEIALGCLDGRLSRSFLGPLGDHLRPKLHRPSHRFIQGNLISLPSGRFLNAVRAGRLDAHRVIQGYSSDQGIIPRRDQIQLGIGEVDLSRGHIDFGRHTGLEPALGEIQMLLELVDGLLVYRDQTLRLLEIEIGLLHVHHDRLDGGLRVRVGGFEVELRRVDLGPGRPEIIEQLVERHAVLIERCGVAAGGSRSPTTLECASRIARPQRFANRSLDLRIEPCLGLPHKGFVDRLGSGGNPEAGMV